MWMRRASGPHARRAMAMAPVFVGALTLLSCGGGTGNSRDAGPNKTTLRVEATDPDGDALHYQWRVTAGSVENRDSNEVTWTLPDGPGLHFAYVRVSDNKGGHVEQQYAVSSDFLGTAAPAVAPVLNAAPVVAAADEYAGGTVRMRVLSGDATIFTASGASSQRAVYLPGVLVAVTDPGTNQTIFSGTTDQLGEVSLPKLRSGTNYAVQCTTPAGVRLQRAAAATCPGRVGSEADACASITGASSARTEATCVAPVAGAARNLRLFGHVDLADGTLCGGSSEYFLEQSTASVRVLLDDGSAATPAVPVNAFGDYSLDAAVLLNAHLKLEVTCESHVATVDVPAPIDPAGYLAANPVELPYRVPNSRPAIVKVVANGTDGNVRGRMVVPLTGAFSSTLPGAGQFLTYKGNDTRLSACAYYRSFGAVAGCDAQGNFVSPISLDDWRRQHKLAPYNEGNQDVAATFINLHDLNLVRRMVATSTSSTDVAFVVCNSPGPDGSSQKEVDDDISTGLADDKRVACVAMEYSPTAGRKGNAPFTKFLTFGPDGRLIASINLDGRGEKYMPGACVACHGGTQYSGRFPATGNPSPDLDAHFLPFDTGNYAFATASSLTEAAQSPMIHALNKLVLQTAPTPATADLIDHWYLGTTDMLDKQYVPQVWQAYDATAAGNGAAKFYRQVVATSCRTCHAAMDSFNWDAGATTPTLLAYASSAQICGGKPDLVANASMPNALISRDLMQARIGADADLAALAARFVGCSQPSADPVYPRH